MKPLRGAGVTGTGLALVVGRGTMVNAAVYALMSLGFPASRVLVHNSSGLDGAGAPSPNRRWARPPSVRHLGHCFEQIPTYLSCISQLLATPHAP